MNFPGHKRGSNNLCFCLAETCYLASLAEPTPDFGLKGLFPVRFGSVQFTIVITQKSSSLEKGFVSKSGKSIEVKKNIKRAEVLGEKF